MRKIFRSSRGQMAVLYAGVAAVLLGAVALGSDVAVMYMNWQQAQKTADAAAIAGANFLTGISFAGTVDSTCTAQSDDAEKAACTYAVKNGIPATTLTLSEPTSTSLKVVVTETGQPYFFARAIGLRTYDIKASATAQGPGNIGTVPIGIFPVGLQCNSPCNLSNFDPGQPIAFGLKFVGGLANGNWQWLSLGGTGSSVLGQNVQNGATGSYSIGDTIHSEPGNKGNSNPVRSGLAARFAQCQSISEPCTTAAANPTDIPADDPCLVVVPAVNFGGCGGNCTMAIEGFALIYLDSTSSATQINGCFVSTVKENTIASATAPALGGLVVDALIQ
ncbi:MAG: pilus assembly protein TadG-related protein [Candidatus Binatus sp.]